MNLDDICLEFGDIMDDGGLLCVGRIMIIIDVFREELFLDYLNIIVKSTLHKVLERRSIKRRKKIRKRGSNEKKEIRCK